MGNCDVRTVNSEESGVRWCSRFKIQTPYPLRNFRRAQTPGGLSIFPCSSTDVRGELENVPRTSAQPLRIFVGATFFRLPCLVGKKGSWGPGQSPEKRIWIHPTAELRPAPEALFWDSSEKCPKERTPTITLNGCGWLSSVHFPTRP